MEPYVLYNVASYKFVAQASVPAVFGFLAETSESTELPLVISCSRIKTDPAHVILGSRWLMLSYIPI